MARACPRRTSHPPPLAHRPTACGRWWFHPATRRPRWGDQIFITGLENNALVVIALRRRDGTLLWRHQAPSDQLEKVHPFSSAAASTPATDGQRVYTYVGSYGLLAYDFTGKEVWRKPLPAPPTEHGAATSPIVFDGKVILQLDGNDGRDEIITVGSNRLSAYSGATVPWPAVMAFADGSKDGTVTKAEWDAMLAFLRSNEDNVLAIRPVAAVLSRSAVLRAKRRHGHKLHPRLGEARARSAAPGHPRDVRRLAGRG